MYCRLYIHSDAAETVIAVLERRFGAARKRYSTYSFSQFSLHLDRNEEADKHKLCMYPDGFLYYEILAELETEGDYIRITDAVLQTLWAHQMPAVASCDYEEALNRFICGDAES